MKLGVPTQNHMPMTMKTSKWKPKIEFQYSGRLTAENRNNISAEDYGTLSRFGVQIDFDVVNC